MTTATSAPEACGVGRLVRYYGLTIDHIRAAEVVPADGMVVCADGIHEPDLLGPCAALAAAVSRRGGQ